MPGSEKKGPIDWEDTFRNEELDGGPDRAVSRNIHSA